MFWAYFTIIILLISSAFYITAGFYMFGLAISRKSNKKNIKKNLKRYGKNNNKSPDHPRYISKELEEWFYNETEKISLSSQGNLLRGYILNQKNYNEKWAIVVHGWTSSARSMIKYGQKFFENGYSVLYIDLASHGKSDGKYLGMGWKDKEDLKKWIDEIIKRDKNAKIVLYGVSMGATTVMMTACENLPKNVVACIEDCGYTSAMEIFKYQFKKNFSKLPSFPILNISSIICKFILGFTFKEASVLKQFEKQDNDMPIMFIHGDSDTFVPTEMVYKLYDSYKSSKKDLYVVKDAEHINSWAVAKEDYWIKIFSFINKYTNL